jgi:hypothetical protein
VRQRYLRADVEVGRRHIMRTEISWPVPGIREPITEAYHRANVAALYS